MNPHQKTHKKSNLGTFNCNPSKKDCIAWQDKEGNIIYREDYENDKYEEYLSKNKNSDEEKLNKTDFLNNILWKKY